MNNRALRETASRAGWTALQAALGVVTADALGLPGQWVPVVATLLVVIKSLVAVRVGDPSSPTFTSPADRDARQDELFP